MKVRTTIAALCLIAAAVPSVADAEGYRPETFWCRGPLSFGFEQSAVEQGVYIYFTGSPQPAGANGERLRAGTCAWASRAFGASDPAKLFLSYVPGASAAESSRSIDGVLQWVLEPDIRYRFEAGVGDRRLRGTVIQVWPPLRTWLEERQCAPKPSCGKPGTEKPGSTLF